jgi:hypothetical protein
VRRVLEVRAAFGYAVVPYTTGTVPVKPQKYVRCSTSCGVQHLKTPIPRLMPCSGAFRDQVTDLSGDVLRCSLAPGSS